MQPRLYASDLVTGLIVALAEGGVETIDLTGHRVDQALGRLMPTIEHHAASHGLQVRFRIRPHHIYGDSPTVGDALNRAASEGIVTFGCPRSSEMRIQVMAADTDQHFQKLPGPKGFYTDLAGRFRELYSA